MDSVIYAYMAYAAIGVVSGIMAGLLGIGGGLITVPSLFFLFSILKFPQAYLMHLAIETSLAAMIFNSLSSTRAHNKKKGVMWPLFKKTVPGLVLGGIIGAIGAEFISSTSLEIIFGLFLCFIGFLFFRRIQPHFKEHSVPQNPVFSLIFMGIGAFAVILGLGGGLFSVPTLTAFRIPQKSAIGTSAAITCLMTIIGTVAFLILGLETVQIPQSIGFINLPAFMIIGFVSVFFAPVGVKWAHELPDQILRRVFGIVLILTGISMLV
ncbi:MAG: sulfite exporter TauE/SafE family protein [Verrucomicrobia bacterium]|nr:sulfite exporter TauE/SafE family protein [Verrucomicrobiota bacterium]